MPGRPDGAGFIRPWQAARLARWKRRAAHMNFCRRLAKLICDYPSYMSEVINAR